MIIDLLFGKHGSLRYAVVGPPTWRELTRQLRLLLAMGGLVAFLAGVSIGGIIAR